MGVFSGIRDAKVSKTGTWLQQGFHKVKIKAVKEQHSQQGNDVFFIVEMDLLETDNEKLEVGKEYSQVINIGKQMGFANIKIFVAAASGVDPNEEDINEQVEAYWTKTLEMDLNFEQICEIICSADQPLAGLEMTLECRNLPTRDDGEFTKHLWDPIEVG